MLSPVRAASNVSLTSQKQAAIVGENLTGANTVMAAIALSGTVDTSVEGKLNMLLLAARTRMVDSLLAVIDAASRSIGLKREAGESNASFALRIADTIRDLTPKQLTTVQQQLNAQGQTIPLQLIAQALHNPTGPQAAQIVAYIELVRYKDLATRAVVNSYGQNGGIETQEPHPSVTAQPPRQDQGMQPHPPQSVSAERPSTAAPASFAASLFAEGAEIQQVEVVEQVLTGGSLAEEVRAEDKRTADPPQPKTAVTSDRPAMPVLRSAAATATVMPGEILWIAADIQEGLKIVLARVIEAAGPELLDIMAEGEQAVDAILAQALIADVLDGEEMQPREAILEKAATPEKSSGDRPAVLSNTSPPLTENDAERAPGVELSQLFDEALIAPPILAESQAKTIAPLPQGIPFAVAQYLPALDDAAESSSLKIDRVDPVDDEEEGQGQGQGEPQDGEEGKQGAASDDGNEAAISQSTDSGEEETAEASDSVATASADAPAPEPLALSMAAPVVPAVDPVYNLYQRMAGWE
ncbi:MULTISPECIES: hypothetical protein [unclassified Sinorhizobium]|uniref:hypothetical protein n=1 Tax=unclassified Sinorhizobium TaxID=2613772 RepID=UPI003525AD4B